MNRLLNVATLRGGTGLVKSKRSRHIFEDYPAAEHRTER